VQWVSNRLKQPVKLPDLTGSGYRLMGGRLIATFARSGSRCSCMTTIAAIGSWC
jgi:anti-sigma factor RsiW